MEILIMTDDRSCNPDEPTTAAEYEAAMEWNRINFGMEV